MSLFVCDNCGTVENTALSLFWMKAYDKDDPKALCSACDPEIGQWHGVFEREQFTGQYQVIWKGGWTPEGGRGEHAAP